MSSGSESVGAAREGSDEELEFQVTSIEDEHLLGIRPLFEGFFRKPEMRETAFELSRLVVELPEAADVCL